VRSKCLDHFRSSVRAAIFVSVFMLLRTVGAGAIPGQIQTQEGARIAEAARAERAPKLDGTLDDPLRARELFLLPFSDFYKLDPTRFFERTGDERQYSLEI